MKKKRMRDLLAFLKFNTDKRLQQGAEEEEEAH